MPTVYDIISEISSDKIIDYVSSKSNKLTREEWSRIVDNFKVLAPADTEDTPDVVIADMIIFDDSEDVRTVSSNYVNEVIAYHRDENDDLDFYDIANANWADIAAMEVCEESLQILLPYEIVGDILLLVASVNTESPEEDGEIVLLTEDNYSVPRGMLYQAFNIPDDRTSEEVDYDKYMVNYSYNHMRETFGRFVSGEGAKTSEISVKPHTMAG
jgi:hypothetical protein